MVKKSKKPDYSKAARKAWKRTSLLFRKLSALRRRQIKLMQEEIKYYDSLRKEFKGFKL